MNNLALLITKICVAVTLLVGLPAYATNFEDKEWEGTVECRVLVDDNDFVLVRCESRTEICIMSYHEVKAGYQMQCKFKEEEE